MDSPLSLQQLVGAAERLAIRDRDQKRQRTDWLGAVELARERLARRPFEALPIPAFIIREGEKERVVTSPQPVDRLVEEALLPIVTAAVEPLLLPSVHAWRRGRSTFTAARDATRLLSVGLHELALLDIADFFPSIDRERLGLAIAEILDAHTAEIVQALIAAPILLDGNLVRPEAGIPLGHPLAPVLANLALVPVDRAIAGCGRELASSDRVEASNAPTAASCEQEAAGNDHERAAGAIGYLRYGDDILLAAETATERNAAEAGLVSALRTLGLSLREEKARRFRYDGTPFVYLGHAVDERGLFERVSTRRLDRIVQGPKREDAEPTADNGVLLRSNRRSRTLYLTEPGLYLRVDAGRVVIKRGPEVVREIPLRRLDRVLILSPVSMSSSFLGACIAGGLPVLFFVGKGRAYGSLVASGMPNPLRLRAQYDLVSRSERRLALARAIVDAKLRAMLRRLERQPAASGQRARVEALLGETTTAMRIRKEGFEYTSRSKRPPRDPLNSLLSFAYSLVFGEMQTALLAHGLDPHPGVLHDLRPRHPALASDLIEPYRVLIADTFVLSVVNWGQFRVDDFERYASGGVFLTPDPRRRFLKAFEKFLARPIGPPGSPTPRALIDGAALAMLRVVVGEEDQLVFPFREEDASGAGEEDAADEDASQEVSL